MPTINHPVFLRRVARGAPEHRPKGFGVAIAHALWQRGNGLLPSLIGTLNPVWGQAFAVDEGKKVGMELGDIFREGRRGEVGMLVRFSLH